MDPRTAIREHIAELQHLIELDKEALAVYSRKPSDTPTSEVKGGSAPWDGLADELVRYFQENDSPEGIIARSIQEARGWNQHAVRKVLDSDKRFIQTNKPAKQHRRYRLKELIEGSAGTTPPPKVDRSPKVSSAERTQSQPSRKRTLSTTARKKQEQRIAKHNAKNREVLMNYAKSHKRFTRKAVVDATGLGTSIVERHLTDMVEAEVLRDIGFLNEFRTRNEQGKPVGRTPKVYESTIFVPPSLRRPTTIVPGQGIRQ